MWNALQAHRTCSGVSLAVGERECQGKQIGIGDENKHENNEKKNKNKHRVRVRMKKKGPLCE